MAIGLTRRKLACFIEGPSLCQSWSFLLHTDVVESNNATNCCAKSLKAPKISLLMEITNHLICAHMKSHPLSAINSRLNQQCTVLSVAVFCVLRNKLCMNSVELLIELETSTKMNSTLRRRQQRLFYISVILHFIQFLRMVF